VIRGAAGRGGVAEAGLADADEEAAGVSTAAAPAEALALAEDAAESSLPPMGGLEALGSSSPAVLPSSPTTWTLRVPWELDGVAEGRAADDMVIVVVEEAPSSSSSSSEASAASPVGVGSALAVTVTVLVKTLAVVSLESSLAADADCEGKAEAESLLSSEPETPVSEGRGADGRMDDEGASPTALVPALGEGTKTRVTF
jgi:hypothetical protein